MLSDNSIGVFNLTSARVDNRGMYTCAAGNGLVNGSLTYNTFVGGRRERERGGGRKGEKALEHFIYKL